MSPWPSLLLSPVLLSWDQFVAEGNALSFIVYALFSDRISVLLLVCRLLWCQCMVLLPVVLPVVLTMDCSPSLLIPLLHLQVCFLFFCSVTPLLTLIIQELPTQLKE